MLVWTVTQGRSFLATLGGWTAIPLGWTERSPDGLAPAEAIKVMRSRLGTTDCRGTDGDAGVGESQ